MRYFKMLQNKSNVEKTFKSKETEEYLDILFYRPFGYRIAILAEKLKLTPNSVTTASIALGVVAGHLFYYNNFTVNVIGIILLIISEALDSADGQLARLTSNFSRFGRILDGFGSNLSFLSIYLHICFRLMNIGYSPFIFLIAVAAGASHSCQSAIGDYGRNFYTFFVYGKEKSELDDSANLISNYPQLKWGTDFYKKLLMRIYINYTVQQEFLAGGLIKLYRFCVSKFSSKVPQQISDLYRTEFRKLIKYYNILTTNTRMIVLFIAILSNYLWLYFAFELTILNALLMYVLYEHSKKTAVLFKFATLN